ncbi:MAG: four helix bundle protein [Synoicihabitans sp.]
MTHAQYPMTSDSDRPKFDLAERTAVFGEQVIDLCLLLPGNPVTTPLINQFIRSSTSVGANYSEANEAESKRDFRHKIALCRKESRETKYWWRMLSKALPEFNERLRKLGTEAHELTLIFAKIIRTTDTNLKAELSRV